jgi:hypothetical protein
MTELAANTAAIIGIELQTSGGHAAAETRFNESMANLTMMHRTEDAAALAAWWLTHPANA